jgi:hypothetical protein
MGRYGPFEKCELLRDKVHLKLWDGMGRYGTVPCQFENGTVWQGMAGFALARSGSLEI